MQDENDIDNLNQWSRGAEKMTMTPKESCYNDLDIEVIKETSNSITDVNFDDDDHRKQNQLQESRSTRSYVKRSSDGTITFQSRDSRISDIDEHSEDQSFISNTSIDDSVSVTSLSSRSSINRVSSERSARKKKVYTVKESRKNENIAKVRDINRVSNHTKMNILNKNMLMAVAGSRDRRMSIQRSQYSRQSSRELLEKRQRRWSVNKDPFYHEYIIDDDDRSRSIEDFIITAPKHSESDIIANKYLWNLDDWTDEPILATYKKEREEDMRLFINLITACALFMLVMFVFSYEGAWDDSSATNRNDHSSQNTYPPTTNFIPDDQMNFLLPTFPSLRSPNKFQERALNWLMKFNRHSSKEQMIQRYILATLYFSTNGESWESTGTSRNKNKKWLSFGNECYWKGIHCAGFLPDDDDDDADEFHHVTVVNLQSIGMGGSIPSEISRLEELVVLNLQDNYLRFDIPESIVLLKKIKHINLSHNQIEGNIPSAIGNMLTLISIDLSYNKIQNQIPTSIGRLKHLHQLNVSHNELSGYIPNDITQLKRLEYLVLDDNKLSGDIPHNITGMESLKTLSLSSNNLSGTISDDLALMTSLRVFNVADNNLSGDVPPGLYNMTQLAVLNISQNVILHGLNESMIDDSE